VCTKAVNENQGEIHLDETRMNLFDGFALEQALLFRDALKESIVDVICVGTDKASKFVQKIMSRLFTASSQHLKGIYAIYT